MYTAFNKMCDKVSDAILDAFLAIDQNAKVVCNTVIHQDTILVFGEVVSTAEVNYSEIIQNTIMRIGYQGFDINNFTVEMNQATPGVVQALEQGREEDDIGAEDQGSMFGYATDETEELMPLTLTLSHKLNAQVADLRRNGGLPWARPYSTAMVTVEYRNDNGACLPLRVHTIVISVEHDEQVQLEQFRQDLMEQVIQVVVPSRYLDDSTIYHLQPVRGFSHQRPQDGVGMTGRQIIVDTYGGWGSHGGGAFSGNDYTNIHRSAAYAARWIAKSLVHARLCRRVEVQVAYATGLANPVSINANSFGTSQVSDAELKRIIERNFDLRPGQIVRDLNLRNPIYERTACYGHFGKPEYLWEQPRQLTI
ncbi:hypothetical protein ACJMK2_004070 [Sinanodonta woodiana]|uniref:S-adenosylmethionine synthase n=1 Tax=Sinanodonta woodiana TaxID=1069815 RepID=A0ABD3Y022_SINWO